MAELTPQGYNLKTQNKWFDEEKQLYLDIDPLWNLDPSTPDGLKLAHDAEIFGALDETLQQAYNSKDPNKATAVDLNVLCALTGTTRGEGTAGTVYLTLSGTAGTFIPAGRRVESVANGSRWATKQAFTLDSTGSATVPAICTMVGVIQADAGTLTRIIDNVGGWVGVTNLTPATVGTDIENDSTLRVKRATAVGRPGNNQIDSMLGELFAVDGVRRVKVYENDTNSAAVTDENPHGLPAHSIAPVIDGGIDTDVAMAIYIKKNPGTRLYQAGTPVSEIVVSPTYPTNSKLIKFSRPIYVDMVIAITLKNDGTLPSDVTLQIQNAFMEFVAGGLVPAQYGFKVQGFDIGEDVPYSTLFTPINQVIGQFGNSYVQTMTVNGTMTNTVIDYNKLSRWTTSNISVTVV
ncbi:baseplate J/gp47 family protein [Yersinia ruckeri]|uniref:baseplate J/gp47 family protein n=1 Tax=Yersinia ruckeri TaxID=29486 RepID=UPI00223858D4|nr:baseplate J/gp47 family protein [Yersinia ruckeri]MCW6550319.1 baseplate J/gp47 family protein [Yersinia ruckeri]